MKVVIIINTDNASFQDNPDQMTSILTDCITACNNGDLENGFDIPLRDYNGNVVGKMLTTDYEPYIPW